LIFILLAPVENSQAMSLLLDLQAIALIQLTALVALVQQD